MMNRDSLGDRMKRYENVTRNYLTRRMPVVIRLDGKAFHSFTRGFKKPFDDILIGSMQETMKYLCENIQGCVLGYTQSDEITLVLVDYQELDTAAWFDYNIQKMASVTASMATWAFAMAFCDRINDYMSTISVVQDPDYIEALNRSFNNGAFFHARVFNIPKEEVTNCVYWRQQDAIRNSIQMVGQSYFSSKALHKKNTKEIKQMLLDEYGINWEDFATMYQRGSCCIKKETKEPLKNGFILVKKSWEIDKDIPIFKNEGREYIDKLIYVGEK